MKSSQRIDLPFRDRSEQLGIPHRPIVVTTTPFGSRNVTRWKTAPGGNEPHQGLARVTDRTEKPEMSLVAGLLSSLRNDGPSDGT